MPRKKKEIIEGITDKLEYLGLNLDKIPENLKKFEPLEYRVSRFYDEKQYRQYRYIDIKDIQILISPTNRLTELDEKYKKARPLYEYLDNKNEENIIKHTTFLNMLKNIDIEQIKQIENKKTGKIFVPISNVKYSNNYLNKSEFEDIENYLWLFTKDWPLIYEVYNKKNELSIQIIGETNVYDKIKTNYKVELNSKEEATEFYKLLKALFILQSEIPNYYNFQVNIDKKCGLEFYLEDQKIEYKNMIEFLREQYKNGLKRRKEIKSKIRTYKKKLKQLQELAASQEIEYLAKEKQISTFLECKKSFFGKVKYFFKYSKKSNKTIKNEEEEIEELETNDVEKKTEIKKEKKKIPIKKIYTLEEIITSYKELEDLETEMKNLLMDINALKLKTKNMAKKIENASKYIEEIDSHKKSIFEFWKYSNKDEVDVLPEGEEEEINVIRKVEKTFDYTEDFEELGKTLDKMQRKNLDNSDTDSLYIATTELIDILNKIKTNTILPEEIEKNLKELKKEAKDLKILNEDEYDIFGNLIENSTKTRKIDNKRHRELPKDKFNILEINKNTKQIGYKLTLQNIIQNIQKALEKGIIPENIIVYKALNDKNLNNKEINVFNINPEKEIEEAIKREGENINLYKINVKEGSSGIGFTNIIFYDNQNKTLPVGMNLSTKLIIDTSKIHLNLVNKKNFNIVNFKDENDDFSDFTIKNITAFEYEMIDVSDLEKETIDK